MDVLKKLTQVLRDKETNEEKKEFIKILLAKLWQNNEHVFDEALIELGYSVDTDLE